MYVVVCPMRMRGLQMECNLVILTSCFFFSFYFFERLCAMIKCGEYWYYRQINVMWGRLKGAIFGDMSWSWPATAAYLLRIILFRFALHRNVSEWNVMRRSSLIAATARGLLHVPSSSIGQYEEFMFTTLWTRNLPKINNRNSSVERF